jgi:hypothetical protein
LRDAIAGCLNLQLPTRDFDRPPMAEGGLGPDLS